MRDLDNANRKVKMDVLAIGAVLITSFVLGWKLGEDIEEQQDAKQRYLAQRNAEDKEA